MKTAKQGTGTSVNAFAGFAVAPTEKQVSCALGGSSLLWKQLLSSLARDLQLTSMEWNTSAPKRGWSLRIKRGERIIAYLVIEQGTFHACFALGDRALKTALASDLPASVLKLIRSAKKCAAGTGIRVPVQELQDIKAVLMLAAAKLA